MSKQSIQIKHMMKSPKAHMDFMLRGKLPTAVTPTSPLIAYLETISPRERLNMTNVRLSPKLGYQSNASFHNAQLLLNYLKPNNWVIGTWPAESVKIKSFNRPITDELFNSCQKR